MMVCHNLCEQFDTDKQPLKYYDGQKFCMVCRVAFNHAEKMTRCPCCGSRMRVRSYRSGGKYPPIRKEDFALKRVQLRNNEAMKAKRVCARCGRTAKNPIMQSGRDRPYQSWFNEHTFKAHSEGWLCGSCGRTLYTMMRKPQSRLAEMISWRKTRLTVVQYDIEMLSQITQEDYNPDVIYAQA